MQRLDYNLPTVTCLLMTPRVRLNYIPRVLGTVITVANLRVVFALVNVYSTVHTPDTVRAFLGQSFPDTRPATDNCRSREFPVNDSIYICKNNS